MKEQKNKNKGNEGFTLVELLIAVAILAVIVVPILGSITTSMKVNKRSDDLLNETAVAQSVMEGMSNQSINDLAVRLSADGPNQIDFLPTSMAASVTGHKEFLIEENSGALQYSTKIVTPAPTTAPTASGTPAVTSIPLEFQKQDSNKYYYGIQGVQYDGKTYDVKITLDASKYYKDPADTTEKYNDVKYVELADYDENQDGLFTEPMTQAQAVYNDYALTSAATGYNRSADEFAAALDREIKVIIKTEPKDGSTERYTSVAVQYTYTAPATGYVDETDRVKPPKEYNIWDNNKADMSDSKPVRNIYILYNPNYASKASSVKDHIIIENEENIPVTVYLVKQNSVEESKIESLENSYYVTLQTKDSLAETQENPTKIRTNLGYNLSNLLKKNEYKKVSGQVDVSFVRGSGTAAQVTKAGDIYSDTLKITGESNETVRIFNRTVEVYESGQYNLDFSGTPLATLSSE
ncbi:MAG: prepilin-type N-terminal cleavage/methylation domain-containing protein [Lachnospiraceae bacterium]|nr:prepilin-type N-terminal cleavage/methylation domain-containing protein [Lachnospiraceae bacterium]